MKIVIEGMDGVGKSTIAKMLAEKLGYDYVESPLFSLFCTNNKNKADFLDYIEKNVYCDTNTKLFKAWCTGLGNIFNIQNSAPNAVIDRHIASNFFWNYTEESSCIFDLLVEIIEKPEITFVLYASPTERRKRIMKRGEDDADLLEERLFIDSYDVLYNCLKKYKFNFEIIDTTNKSINDVLNYIMKYLTNNNSNE